MCVCLGMESVNDGVFVGSVYGLISPSGCFHVCAFTVTEISVD